MVPDAYPGFEQYAGWLSIPYLVADGHPVSIRFRRPDWDGSTHPAKYLSMPHEPGRIYGVSSFLGASPDLHVAEGEFDSLILKKVFGNGIGYPGATFGRKHPHHRVLMEGFARVFVWGDGDEAGRAFANELAALYRNVVPIYMPSGMDVTDAYLEHGEDKLRAMVKT